MKTKTILTVLLFCITVTFSFAQSTEKNSDLKQNNSQVNKVNNNAPFTMTAQEEKALGTTQNNKRTLTNKEKAADNLQKRREERAAWVRKNTAKPSAEEVADKKAKQDQ